MTYTLNRLSTAGYQEN